MKAVRPRYLAVGAGLLVGPLLGIAAIVYATSDTVQGCADAITARQTPSTDWPHECAGLTDWQRQEAITRALGLDIPTTPTANTSTSQNGTLRIGDSVTTGDPDTAQRVTLEELRTGLQSTPGDSPGPGRDLIGIRVTIENVGKTGIVDSASGPLNIMQWNMYDQNGHAIPIGPGPAENTIGESLPGYRLRPGQTATGWINLTAPTGTTVATVTLTTGSDTTEWTVPATGK